MCVVTLIWFFNTNAKVIHWTKYIAFQQGRRRKLDFNSHLKKINYELIKDLNVGPGALKFLEEKHRVKSSTHTESFWKGTRPFRKQSQEWTKESLWNDNASCPGKETRCSPETGRNIWQVYIWQLIDI